MITTPSFHTFSNVMETLSSCSCLTPSVITRETTADLLAAYCCCFLHDPSTTMFFSPDTHMKGPTQMVYNDVYKNKWQQTRWFWVPLCDSIDTVRWAEPNTAINPTPFSQCASSAFLTRDFICHMCMETPAGVLLHYANVLQDKFNILCHPSSSAPPSSERLCNSA